MFRSVDVGVRDPWKWCGAVESRGLSIDLCKHWIRSRARRSGVDHSLGMGEAAGSNPAESMYLFTRQGSSLTSIAPETLLAKSYAKKRSREPPARGTRIVN
jgi:hypothetical protein